MLLGDIFKGKTEFYRSGETKKVVLPVEFRDRLFFDITVDSVNAEVKFSEGDSVYIVTDSFGIYEETIATMFFIDGGFVIELVCGSIYMKGDNGVVYKVDELGDMEYPDSADVESKVYWVELPKLYEYASIMVKDKYKIPSDDLVGSYVDNLAYTLILEYSGLNNLKNNGCFRVKFDSYYLDLGLGKFIFLAYDDRAFNDMEIEEDDVYEDVDDEDEFELDDEGYGLLDEDNDEDEAL